MALLTDRTLAQSSAITPTTLIHIVTTGDTSQNPAGSSYKAELGQLISVFSAGTDGSNSRRWTNLNTALAPLSGGITIRKSGGAVTLDPSLVTNMRISRYDNTTADMNSWFTALDNYTNTNPSKAYIQITDTLDNSIFGIYEVGNVNFFTSGGNDYWQIGTTYISGSVSLFSTTNTLTVSWVLFGSDSPPFTGGSSNCITDFYVTNMFGCSPITFQDSFQITGSTASGTLSIAEGLQTTASGDYSHSEGFKTTASGNYSHSEGNGTQSVNDYSHTSGLKTRSNGDYQVVVGQYNDYTKPRGNSAFIIGNGTSPGFESDLLVAVSSQVSIFGTLDVTGLTKTDNFRLTTSPNNGYVLVSDGSGNGTWQSLSAVTGTSLTSVTGITTSAFTATTSYEYYGVEYTGTTSIEIPSASGIDGFKFSIKDERGTAATYPITITPDSGSIDGNPFVTMAINYMSLTMVARNNNWWII